MTTPRIVPPHVDAEALTKGSAFQAARKHLALTQSQLAQLLDVHVYTLRGWEHGRRPISRVVALAMAHLLSTPSSTWPPPIPRSPWKEKP